MSDFFEKVKGGLIVSCQALPDEPLHSSFIMGRLALAALQGGASGIRANTKEDILEIKRNVDLPVIGIVKRDYEDSEVFITATIKEVAELMESGCEMIACDATKRIRPNGQVLDEFVREVKSNYPDILLMADVSTTEEAIRAQELGFDCVSTTLAGYTSYTEGAKLYDNDFELLKDMLQVLQIPVISEGNVITPEMAARCLELGATSVVVGGAITRPKQITERFIEAMKK